MSMLYLCFFPTLTANGAPPSAPRDSSLHPAQIAASNAFCRTPLPFLDFSIPSVRTKRPPRLHALYFQTGSPAFFAAKYPAPLAFLKLFHSNQAPNSLKTPCGKRAPRLPPAKNEKGQTEKLSQRIAGHPAKPISAQGTSMTSKSSTFAVVTPDVVEWMTTINPTAPSGALTE